jgi:hypothetical protein
MANIDSPCIGICSTTYGDAVCRGCKRHYDEVISWNALNDNEKQSVLERIDSFTASIVADFISVTAQAKLEQALKQWGVRYREDDEPLSWALQLLKFADDKIESLAGVGLQAKEQYASLSMHALCNIIDKALYQYACQQQSEA